MTGGTTEKDAMKRALQNYLQIISLPSLGLEPKIILKDLNIIMCMKSKLYKYYSLNYYLYSIFFLYYFLILQIFFSVITSLYYNLFNNLNKLLLKEDITCTNYKHNLIYI